MLELSPSQAAIARACWKKYYWKYIEGLEPIKRDVKLTLGGVVHEAFDEFYNGHSETDILTEIKNKFDQEISRLTEPGDVEKMIIAKYTAVGMWAYYPYKNKNDFQEIHSEEEFSISFGRKVRGVRLRGRVDGRVKKENCWWVREVKTTSNAALFEKQLDVADQATGYVYALRKLGFDVVGVMYDLIRKPLLRQRAQESVDDFGKRIMADYKERPDEYYTRPYTYRTHVDLKHYEEDMIDLAREIRDHRRRGLWRRNPDACWRFNRECEFKKICFQENPDPLTIQLYYTKKQKKDQPTQQQPEDEE